MQSSFEYMCGSILFLIGIGYVINGVRAIRTGKAFDTRSFISYKGKAAEIYGKRTIQFAILFIVFGVLMIVLGIYSEFH